MLILYVTTVLSDYAIAHTWYWEIKYCFMQISHGEYKLFSANIFFRLRAFIKSFKSYSIYFTFHLVILKFSEQDLNLVRK